MTAFEDAPREPQALRLPEHRVEQFREWAREGTALTAAARVHDPDGRIALVRNRWSDGWVLPGGAVEPGETPVDAAHREVREETGLDAEIEGPLVVLDQSYVDDGTGATRFTAEYVVYDARADGPIPDGSELGVSDDEIAAARWFEGVPADLHDDVLRPYLE